MPIIFDRIRLGKRYVIRKCSNRLTVINTKTYQVMREIDFANHETALHFAHNLTN